MFVYLRQVCTRNQPQPLQENVERPFRINQYNDPKAWSLDETTIPRLNFRNYVIILPLFLKALYCVLLLHIVLTFITGKRANGQYQNTVKDLLLQNTVNKKNEKSHTAGLNDTAIPHIKIKIPQFTVNPLMSPSSTWQY